MHPYRRKRFIVFLLPLNDSEIKIKIKYLKKEGVKLREI